MKSKGLSFSCYVLILFTSVISVGSVFAVDCKPATSGSNFKITFSAGFASPKSSVSDLMTSDGNLYLFRVIDRKYQKGYVGAFAEEEGSISYSLNPYISRMWTHRAQTTPEAQVLIGFHNIYSEVLLYPTLNDYIGTRLKTRLTLRTRLEDIHYLNQVNVPLGKERIIAIIPLVQFVRIAEDYSKKSSDGFSTSDLVKCLIQSTRRKRISIFRGLNPF